jgi:hypothetical protein
LITWLSAVVVEQVVTAAVAAALVVWFTYLLSHLQQARPTQSPSAVEDRETLGQHEVLTVGIQFLIRTPELVAAAAELGETRQYVMV